jgi:hypothetical protein
MDQLPDELIELIAMATTCQSLGRLSRTARRFQQIIQHPRFWRDKLCRDYPEMLKRINLTERKKDSVWLEFYQLAYSWHRQFCQEFPTLIREAEYLVRTNHCWWKKVYLNVKMNPLLVYPEVRKICTRLDRAFRRPSDGFTSRSVARTNLKPHLELSSDNAMYFDLSMRQYDLVFDIPTLQEITAMFHDPVAPQPLIPLTQLVERFKEYWAQLNLRVTIQVAAKKNCLVCLRIHGFLQTQPTGVHIWMPHVARIVLPRPYSNRSPYHQN